MRYWKFDRGGHKYLPGGLLLAWEEFVPNAKIIGVDIDPMLVMRVNKGETGRHPTMGGVGPNHPRISALQANSTDVAAVAKLNVSGIDVIIDDGLHTWEGQQQTLVAMWPCLRPGGYYFIEDVGEAQPASNKAAARILTEGKASLVLLGKLTRQRLPGNIIMLLKSSRL